MPKAIFALAASILALSVVLFVRMRPVYEYRMGVPEGTLGQLVVRGYEFPDTASLREKFLNREKP